MKRRSISLILSDNANQSYNEISTSYPPGWLLSKNEKTAGVCRGVISIIVEF